jgi:lactam utilization protein B
MAVDGTVVAVDGTVVDFRIASLCVHGDTPGAMGWFPRVCNWRRSRLVDKPLRVGNLTMETRIDFALRQ